MYLELFTNIYFVGELVWLLNFIHHEPLFTQNFETETKWALQFSKTMFLNLVKSLLFQMKATQSTCSWTGHLSLRACMKSL